MQSVKIDSTMIKTNITKGCPYSITERRVSELIPVLGSQSAGDVSHNTQGDSDVISMPAGFRRHLVAKTLINVFQCDSAEIRFVGKLVIIQTFS